MIMISLCCKRIRFWDKTPHEHFLSKIVLSCFVCLFDIITGAQIKCGYLIFVALLDVLDAVICVAFLWHTILYILFTLQKTMLAFKEGPICIWLYFQYRRVGNFKTGNCETNKINGTKRNRRQMSQLNAIKCFTLLNFTQAFYTHFLPIRWINENLPSNNMLNKKHTRKSTNYINNIDYIIRMFNLAKALVALVLRSTPLISSFAQIY